MQRIGGAFSPARVASPTITSVSPETNVIGGITDADVLTVDGTAVAGSTVDIYDGTRLVGTAVASASGVWTFKTGTLADGVHDLTAIDSIGGSASASSAVAAITVDTVAPAAPVIAHETATGIDQELLSGTAEANSKVTVYDGTVQLGSATTNGSGAWSLTTITMPTGLQAFTATATDAAGNVSIASHAVTETVGTQAAAASSSTVAPGAAALAGYTHLSFDDEFTSLSSIDMSNSHAAGYDWYLQNWFSTGATNANDISISNGALELGGGTGEAVLVSAFANSSGGYTGTVFGDGAFMEASIKFNPGAGGSASYWPAFWGESIEHIIGNAQMSGQAAGYNNFVEADIMEYMNGLSSSQYLGTIHDWSGTYTSNGWQFNVANYGNSTINVGSVNWNAFHTYGLLWVPQSGSTPGHVTWYFDGQAEGSIYWLGPATASMPGLTTGSDTPSTSAQAGSTYSVLDSQQLALSLQTDSTWPMYVQYVQVWQEGSTPVAVAAPVIKSFSPDTGVVGDGITNATTVVLSGTAEANSVELVYDGTTWLGSATANAAGAWSFTASALSNGTHSFSATSTDTSGNTSADSAALTVTVDTVAPAVTASLTHDTGSSAADHITSNDMLTGTGDPSAVVHFTVDGKAIATTVTASATGAWSFTPTGLADGNHTVVASETDVAGNTGTASFTFTLDTTPPTVAISNESFTGGKVTLSGTASEAGDTIAIYDGATLVGTTVSSSGDAWSFTTGSVSNTAHTYTATGTDLAGNVGHSGNDAILGSTGADTLTATGNDIIIGNGGNDTFVGGGGGNLMVASAGNDTFLFKATTDSTPTHLDTIANFNHATDIIEFSGISGINATNGVPTFQGQLTGSGNLSLHAHSIAYIETGGNTDVLVNTTGVAETISATNMHAATMQIVLNGIHLGLTSGDFHLA